MVTIRVARMTEEEYLAYDLAHEGRHEYVNGEVVAMAGATEEHCLVHANVLAAFVSRLRGGPCTAVGPDMRVNLNETGMYAYPDVVVRCGKAEFAPTRPVSLLNPKVIVEVLSDSTEDYDRGAKVAHYRRRATVEAILLVDSRERRVELQSRNADGTWTLSEHTDGVVVIPSPRLDLSMAELYDGWPPPA